MTKRHFQAVATCDPSTPSAAPGSQGCGLIDAMATIVGYARISTGNQRLDMQLDALTASGCTRIHTDTASGALAARPGLDQALAELDEGDTLVVWRLDRLGRSLPHLVATIDNLTRRGINLKSLHEAIDTTTPTGRLMVHLIASHGGDGGP